MVPCTCGYYDDPVQECTCSNAVVSRYQAGTRHPVDSFAFAQDRLGAAAGPRLYRAQVNIHSEVPRVEATLRVGEKLAAAIHYRPKKTDMMASGGSGVANFSETHNP